MREPKLTLGNVLGHFRTINKHKLEVMKACLRAGLVWRGLVHDLSKYSPVEFLTSARYYQGGTFSPINAEKYYRGFSLAEQHHHGHNSHHWEYWITGRMMGGVPIKVPLKVAVEMVCDFIAAGKIYEGKRWTPRSPYEHLKKNIENGICKFHPATEKLILRLQEEFMDNGFAALKAKNVRRVADDMGYDEIPSVDNPELLAVAKRVWDLAHGGIEKGGKEQAVEKSEGEVLVRGQLGKGEVAEVGDGKEPVKKEIVK